MATNQRGTVVGVFRDRGQADQAVQELRQAGFRSNQIGVVGRDKKGRAKVNDETYAEEGAVAGALAGAGVGGLIGLGVLSGVIPVIGPAIAAGTLGTILLNAAGGAAVASLAGALIGLGIPEDEAEYYEKELKAGRFLVTVKAGRRTDEARAILRRAGGYDRDSAATARGTTRTASTTRAASGRTSAHVAEGQAIEVREEELRPRKTTVKKGEVKVRKDVVTEHKTLSVPVTREEVVVERRPANGRRAAAGAVGSSQEIRIPVLKEEVHVEKTPVVKEEVRVGKRRVQGTQEVAGTVRKERVRVEQEGDANVRGEACPTPRGRQR